MRMSEVKCVVYLLRCMFQDDGETFWCQHRQWQYIDNVLSVYQTVVISFNRICLNDANLPIVEEGDLTRNHGRRSRGDAGDKSPQNLE